MDVVLVCPQLNTLGGIQRVVIELARKFNPVIYTAHYAPEFTYPQLREFDIRVLRRSGAERALFPADSYRYGSLRFLRTKLRDDYDVISAHNAPAEFIRLRNPRVCWTLYAPLRQAYDLYQWNMSRMGTGGRLLNGLAMGAYRLADSALVPRIEKICPISEVVDLRLRKYLKRTDGEVVHIGINPSEFSCGSYGDYFLYVSRFAPNKRFEYAIEAFRIFTSLARREKNGTAVKKLVLAGFARSPDEPYLKKLRSLAAGLPIEFLLNPDEKEVRELYAGCYATLFSALDEDYGLVPLEAMASRKPCVSVREGGPLYTIADGQTGFLVGSPEEMARRMLELASDRSLAERMGKAGRKRVLERFTMEAYLGKMEKAFREAAAANDRG